MSIGQYFHRLHRALIQLWFWDVWVVRPAYPLSWRYLLPGQAPNVQRHRRLWWHSRYKLPGLLWLPLECLRWLAWQLWLGPKSLRLALASNAAEVEQRFGIAQNVQRRQLAYWMRAWCIDPFEAYDWQLYRPDKDGLALIFTGETSAFHRLQNRKSGATNADHRLLGDKLALANGLKEQGIPMVPTQTVSHGEAKDLVEALAGGHGLFCKLRSGNQGDSAFACWANENTVEGETLHGTPLPDRSAVMAQWQRLCRKGPVLIQPLLLCHADLANVCAGPAVPVLRLVTRLQSGSIMPWWAELQVPEKPAAGKQRGFWRFPVTVAEGAVSAMAPEWLLRQSWQNQYDALAKEVCSHVPDWQTILANSIKAHSAMPKLWAVAWDWVLTPEGPVLLEGNGGWGLRELQHQQMIMETLQ